MNTTASLPIQAILPALHSTLAAQTCAIVVAPPGSGKTTGIPLAVLHDEPSWLAQKRILMLEPRRLAARQAARYMAQRLGEPVGERVGYRTRLDSRISANTRLEVVTEGVLTRLLREDPELSEYGLVIFDEFHERSLQADLGLVLTRESQQALREDLRIVVMSATLDADALAHCLGGCPVLHSEGRSFPVSVSYSPPGRTPWLAHMAREIRLQLQQHSGSLLAFLPGEAEIRRLADLLSSLPSDTQLHPLYGQLSGEAQDQAMAPAPEGQRKVVLATAIAETSLTIEGITLVVDSGWARTAVYDAATDTTRLQTQRLSQAAAEQRRGRAGRLSEGHCVRLWDHEEHGRLRAFSTAEILQTDLTDTVLALADWGVRELNQLRWLEAPPAPAWAQARNTLTSMQALDGQGGITPYGKSLLAQGVSPRLAHLLLSARAQGQPRLGAELVALLEERDPLGREHGADIALRVNALRLEQLPDKRRLQSLRERVRRWHASAEPASTASLGGLLAQAWPDRVARRRPGPAPRYLLSNGRGAILDAQDPLAHHEWLVIAAHDGDPREAKVFLAAALSSTDTAELIAQHAQTEHQLAWDESLAAVRATAQQRLGQIVLREQPLPNPDPEQCTPLLLDYVQRTQLQSLPWTDALRQWQARVCLMHRLEPEHWPDLSDQALLASLPGWLTSWLSGMTRASQLAQLPLQQALLSQLDWPQQQQLDEQLPAAWLVPSGSRIAIDYCAAFHGGQQPVLAVKLQELFGLDHSPRLAHGRLTLSMHLLSPAQRPMAITSDLASFWRGAYHEVRKDLRGRYPKHPWPEDPLAAQATRFTKRTQPP